MLTHLARQKRSTRPETTLNSDPAPLPRPRILIIENESILGAGIERLLADRARLDVIGVTSVNGTMLIDTIKQLQPDVIILDEAHLLAMPFNFLTALLDYPSLRVMVISAHHNRVQICHKQQLLVTQVTDLVSLIQRE
jgi:chemotaxis response regulator CheB